MPYLPYRLQRGWIGGETWNDVPVNVGELVAEEFVVDLSCVVGLRDGPGDQVHFLHQLNPFCRRQVKEFRRVTLKDHHRPARKKLIVVEIDFRQPEIDNEVVGARPGPCAGMTPGIGHG